MKRSTLAVIAVVVGTVLVVGGVAAALALGTDGAAAVTVGDSTVSRQSVNDELRAIVDNPKVRVAAGPDNISSSPGSMRSDAATALVLTGVVQEALIRQVLADRGEKITAADRATARKTAPRTQIGQFYSDFPQWYRDRYTGRIAAYAAMARVLGVDLQDDGAEAAITKALRNGAKKFDVTVDPRYGRYAPKRVQVDPYVAAGAKASAANQSGSPSGPGLEMTKVVVVGLGPAGAELLLPAARAVLAGAPVRYVRTARHPAVDDLAADGLTFESFDAVYDSADDLDSVYREIVDTLVAAAARVGEVVYAVPGSPVVAERTVGLLRERARGGEIELEIIPGLSFAELAWVRLGVDPLDGARVVDGRALEPADLELGGPLLIAQLDSGLALSDVKLALLERVAPDLPITLLHHLGRDDERVERVPLADADRVLAPDHLTALFVDLPPGPADAFGALLALGRRLRGPGGCPWDAEQTHHSLTRYLLEEAYEVVDAIEALPIDAPGGDEPASEATWAALADELGDLLFQVVFHAVLAEEADAFTATDIAEGIHAKLVRRHPHVFGEVAAETSGDVMRNWEQIKKGERNSDSLVDTVPPGLPALLYTHKLYRKAASIGLDPGDRDGAVGALSDALDVLRANDATVGTEVALGDLLAASVVLARAGGVDAESALRGWATRYRAHFQRMEVLARDRGLDLHTLDPERVDALWAETADATA